MKIATWNLQRPRLGTTDKNQRIVAKLRELDADVWILTETHERIDLGKEYELVPSQRIETQSYHTAGECRTAVLSRFPIRATKRVHDPETSVCVEIESPLGPWLVFGTVLPYDSAGRRYSYRHYGADVSASRSYELQEDAIARLGVELRELQSLHPNHSLCFGGDVNQARNGKTLRAGSGRNNAQRLLDEALARVGAVCVTALDVRGHCSGFARAASIDHLWLSERWQDRVQCVAWEPGDRDDGRSLSDHSGVSIELQ